MKTLSLTKVSPLAILALGLFFLLPSLEAEEQTPDLQALQGTWTLQEGETGGRPLPAYIQLVYTFDGNRLTMASSNGSRYEVKFHLDTEADPKRLTYTLRDEVDELILNHWIYQIEGDTLSLCGISNTRPGITAPFPETFESKKGPNLLMLLKLRRTAANSKK